MEPRLEHILTFVNFLHQVRAVERRLWVKQSERRENDAEHSYSLAMLAWYMNSVYRLGLDQEKILMYSLAHDVIEVYAGDTYFYEPREAHKVSKQEREAAAVEKIREEFPESESLHQAIDRYEAREDKESRFVYALDKVEPVLSIYSDGGKTWKKEGVTLDMLVSTKTDKVAIDSSVSKLFEDLVARLRQEHDELFNVNS